jgi:hypothetical protein
VTKQQVGERVFDNNHDVYRLPQLSTAKLQLLAADLGYELTWRKLRCHTGQHLIPNTEP